MSLPVLPFELGSFRMVAYSVEPKRLYSISRLRWHRDILDGRVANHPAAVGIVTALVDLAWKALDRLGLSEVASDISTCI